MHIDRTAVGLHQLTNQRQANAQTFALMGLMLVVGLPEQIEDFLQAVFGEPRALSITSNCTHRSVRLITSCTCPSCEVNLSALLTRFQITCSMRVGSASTNSGSAGEGSCRVTWQ